MAGKAKKSPESEKVGPVSEAKGSVRSPICTVLGHVDHGKSSILDFIRHTAIVKSEAGAITQAIGASIIPLETIQKVCGGLLKNLKLRFTIPGLLFIDTPGHAAFTSLRKRGGSLADIAILVIDIKEGIMPQTIESIEILKQSKTPFVIAANKIDLISGWNSGKGGVLQEVDSQQDHVKEEFEKKIYGLVGQLYEKTKLNGDRFDRIDNYTKNIAIVPTSAKTGQGIPELLMVITGLAQKYLEGGLKIDVSGAAKGTVLEVKEEKGMGAVLDTIIYDGTLHKNDTIVIGGVEKAIITKVKALFEPNVLVEMRDKKAKFKSVSEVRAAIGVRISAPNIKDVVAGMPIVSAKADEIGRAVEEIQKEVGEILIATDKKGIVIKADSLGSLEALAKLLKDKGIKIQKAAVGDVTKKDVSEAECIYEEDSLQCAILGFNVKDDSKIFNEKVKVITNSVIYKLIEDFEGWQEEQKKKIESKEFEKVAVPAKIQSLKGYVFRQSNPAIVGVEILEGKLKTQSQLINKNGKIVGVVKSIQQEKENLSVAEKGKQVAVSIEGATVGRQINEGDTLYSYVPEQDFRKLKELKKNLKKEDIALLKEIAEIMRKENPTWGV